MQAQQYDPLAQIHLLFIHGKSEELIQFIDSLALRERMGAELFYYRGLAFRDLSRHDSAVYYFRQALERDPGNLFYKKTLGTAYHSLGRTREAI
jgi:tetratricopeptide (TPR) repeat protein